MNRDFMPSESQFQGWVTATGEAFGYRSWHVPTPMRPVGGGRFVPDPRGRGLLDLLMIREKPTPRLLFAECKAIDGRFSVEQREMIRLLRLVSGRIDRYVDLAALIPAEVEDGLDFANPVGVFEWRPGAERAIEAILKA